MWGEFFSRGFIMGFAIAAPVGPIGLLCIQRTLNSGRKHGLATGLGAATADACYGTVAALGLTAIASLLESMQLWLALAGGAFLAWLGVKTFMAPPATQAAALQPANLLADYGSALGLTLTNPATIFSFLAVFAGMGLATTGGDYLLALMMVLGVFLGSAAWWLILSTGTALLRTRITANTLRWVNRTAGVLITGFAVYLLVGVVRP